MTELKIVLLGEPMPKQSVRKGINRKTGKAIFYQPKKQKDREADYTRQIKKQLPKGFSAFKKKVYIEMMEYMFAPLSEHKKVKYKMDHLESGGIYEKTTKPDLSDNLKKLPLDALSGLVYKDDALICRENNISKVYGIRGQITIILRGE